MSTCTHLQAITVHTAHYHDSGHPLIHSLEPGEEWTWCYEDEVAMLIPQIEGQTQLPPSPMLAG
jgi:hypothetical protein